MIDPASLVSDLFVSSMGYVAFVYGKRQRRLPQLVVGLALLVFPYFVDQVWLTWLVAGVLVLALWFAVKLGW